MNRVFFGLLGISLLTIYGMFTIKYNSRAKLRELYRIDKMIIEEERKIKLLKVDLEHVSRPEAIRRMLYLLPHLEPIKPSQVIILKSAP
jgi:hypothetical protein